MNNKSIILSALLVIVIAFLLGIAIGYGMSKVDVSASAPTVNHSFNAQRVLPALHYEKFVVFTVVERCFITQPIKHPVSIEMYTIRTNVLVHTEQEDNSNTDIVTNTVTPTPVITIIVTPTLIITTVPTSTSTVVPTATPVPAPKDKGNEGLGNGPDSDNHGHEGDTDDNDNQGPQPNECGTPGHPCKKEHGMLSILPLFSILIIGEHPLAKLMNDYANRPYDEHDAELHACNNCTVSCNDCLDNCVEDVLIDKLRA